MRTTRWFCSGAAWLLLGVCLSGCSSGGNPKQTEEKTGAETASTSASNNDPAPEKKEILLEPFDPPPLAELDAKAGWEPQLVGDTLQMLRAAQSKKPPQVSVETALKLRNTGPENNEKIVSALGRVGDDDAQIDYDAVMNRHSRVDVRSTNPILTSSFAETDVNGLTGFGMFGFDRNMDPLATSDTVKSWESSKDRLYDKVVMRDDLTWSDGQPITAHDVVFSFQTIMNPDVPVPAVRGGTDKLRWVHAYDDHTLVFFHKESLATNVWNINFPILPKHVYEESLKKDPTLKDSEYHVKLEENPVCGGAYTITKRIRGQEIVLTRRESWYMHQGKQVRDKPYFREVRFRIMEDPNIALLALKNGEIDEMELNPEQWMTQTTEDDFYRLNTKASGVEWTGFSFCWNLRTPYFSDIRVRKAMSYAFNHKEMLDKLFYGLYQPSNGIFNKASWMAPKNAAPPYSQDLDKAEQLLDEAGWQDHDDDGFRDKEIDGKRERFEFSILVANIPDRIKICTLLKENLAQIGVVCNVRPIEFAVLQEKMQNHEFQAAFGGWGTGTDPDTSENIWGTGQERNYNFYSNKDVDRYFEQGRHEFDRARRAAIYGKIHEIIYADQPCTWLFYRNSFFAFSKQLRGYNFSPRGPFHFGPGFSSIYKIKQ